jgi:predicted permease
MIALGFAIKKIGVINENFVAITSKFVFNVSLPAFIFMKISALDLHAALDMGQIIFIYAGTLLVYFTIWIISSLFIKDGRNLSVFVQGAYRSNYAIVGLAIIANLFGDEGLGKASLILAFLLPFYNVLAVVILTVPMRKIRKLNLLSTVYEVILNPLIIAVIISVPFSYFKLELPSMLFITGNFLSNVALPLALIGIGGSLNIVNIKRASALAFNSSMLKLIVVPIVLTFFAYLFGYRGMDLGIMFILFACPTAIVSFIMAEAMGCNGKLAGNIVVISTIGSVFTISAAIIFLKSLELI